jgi:hypothetical protein
MYRKFIIDEQSSFLHFYSNSPLRVDLPVFRNFVCAIALILFRKFGPQVSFKELIIGFASGLSLRSNIFVEWLSFIIWPKKCR